MRGEKYHLYIYQQILVGSPPHARGKANRNDIISSHRRITPACAGKSYIHNITKQKKQDHPRMRGEKADML